MMRLFVVIFFTSVLLSCAPAVMLPPDLSLGKELLLPFRIDSIEVIDQRPDTVTREMNLPVFAAKRSEWIVRPGLSKELMTEVISMITASSNAEGLPVIVTLVIEDGYYKISGSASKVGEHTRFACSLNFQLLESNEYYRSSANAFFDQVGVFNATEKHVKELYRIAIRNSIFKALKQAESVLDN